MFWFVKTVHSYSARPESKLNYHMSMLFAYMAGGEGVEGGGLEVLKCFVRVGVRIFILALCVCGGGMGIRFSTSPSAKKNNRPPPITK